MRQDDTIGTLSRLADDTREFHTYMVSQDKDLGQLISPSCYLWRPGKRGNDHEVIDLEKLKEHWGIERAEQVIDILALMGDSSDNIPGLPRRGGENGQAADRGIRLRGKPAGKHGQTERKAQGDRGGERRAGNPFQGACHH